MEQSDEPLSGKVELDETWVGGKRKFPGRKGHTGQAPGFNSLANKTPVAGAVERGGRGVAVTVPNVKRVTLLENVQKRVLPKSTVLHG